VRISNSPLFGCRVASVEEAVSRVGFGEILRLVGTATTGRFADRALDHYGITALQLRDNMLSTAFACEELARHSDGDSRIAYTARPAAADRLHGPRPRRTRADSGPGDL
jgi:HD-like signal output (HDOD) protein